MDKLGKFDRAIRALLAFENPNSCIRSLSNSLYQTIEISGYAVSDCLEANFKSVQNVTGDYLADIYASDVLLETSQKSYWKLLLAATCSPSLTKSFKGFNRNVTLDYPKTFDRLLEKSNKFAFAWHDEAFAIESCLKKAQEIVKAPYDLVQARIPVCRAFSGKLN